MNSPIPVHFSSLVPKMSMFTLAICCLTTSNLPSFMDLTFQVPMQYCSLQHQTLLPSPVNIHNWVLFSLWLHLFIFFWNYFSTLFQYHIGHLPTWGVYFSLSCLFAFSYCSWGSQGNTEVVCKSFFQWITFCQTWPVCLGWPYMAWLIVSLN